MKRKFYTELAYVLGLLTLALGAALMTMADFGLSMIVAPAYLLHLKVSEYLPFFSFGMAEYSFQALLLVVTVAVLRHFKISYLLSFVTAFIYGMLLDGYLFLLSFIGWDPMYMRIGAYTAGIVLTVVGVALFFRTYISPEVYELLVKEVSKRFELELGTFKTVYDMSSLFMSVVLSFAFFGLWHFEGIGWGTLICALINGRLIALVTKLLDRRFEFCDGLRWRSFFE